MHSRGMSKFRSKCSQANWSIGDTLPAPRINCADTNKKITDYLRSRGDANPNMSRLGRIRAKWMKIKHGKIDRYHASLLRRDHAKEFAMFEEEERKGKA